MAPAAGDCKRRRSRSRPEAVEVDAPAEVDAGPDDDDAPAEVDAPAEDGPDVAADVELAGFPEDDAGMPTAPPPGAHVPSLQWLPSPQSAPALHRATHWPSRWTSPSAQRSQPCSAGA